MISIQGLDRAAVLAALYNASQPLGAGILQYDPADMTLEDAAAIIAGRKAEGLRLYFDYLRGRVIKADLAGDWFSAELYDQDNGVGAAARAVAPLRMTASKQAERSGEPVGDLVAAAKVALDVMRENRLGFTGAANSLAAAIERVEEGGAE